MAIRDKEKICFKGLRKDLKRNVEDKFVKKDCIETCTYGVMFVHKMSCVFFTRKLCVKNCPSLP